MKKIINYIVCSLLLAVGILLITAKNPCCALAGLTWFGMCYAIGLAFPSLWKQYFKSNVRLCKKVGIL